MESTNRHALLVGAEAAVVRRLTPILRTAGFEVHTAPTSEQVLDLVQGTRFEVVLVCFPLRELSIVNLIRAMRDRTSACRFGGLLLLCEHDVTEQARSYLNRGANRVLHVDCSADQLVETLSLLLDVAPRTRVRLLVTVEAGVGLDRVEDLGRIENLSRTGMLISGTRRLSPGNELEFEFFAEGVEQPIRGTGEVVRRTDPEREGIEGLGVRFAALRPGCRELLEKALRIHFSG